MTTIAGLSTADFTGNDGELRGSATRTVRPQGGTGGAGGFGGIEALLGSGLLNSGANTDVFGLQNQFGLGQGQLGGNPLLQFALQSALGGSQFGNAGLLGGNQFGSGLLGGNFRGAGLSPDAQLAMQLGLQSSLTGIPGGFNLPFGMPTSGFNALNTGQMGQIAEISQFATTIEALSARGALNGGGGLGTAGLGGLGGLGGLTGGGQTDLAKLLGLAAGQLDEAALAKLLAGAKPADKPGDKPAAPGGAVPVAAAPAAKPAAPAGGGAAPAPAAK
jgi:hypothetical protein